jgi:hypothetical protein
MTVITLGEAEQEFAESVDYYESNEAGLGARLRDEVAEAVQRIENHPELPRLRPKGYRRVNLRAAPSRFFGMTRVETNTPTTFQRQRRGGGELNRGLPRAAPPQPKF